MTHDVSLPLSKRWLKRDLAEALARQLGLDRLALGAGDNLLRLGLDSLDILGWAHRFQASGARIGVSDLYRRPTLEGWLSLLRAAESGDASSQAGGGDWPLARPGEPFPLTPVQHAYLVGRSRSRPLGGVGCHLYQEFDGAGIEPRRLDAALSALMDRHPMLRARFHPDGTQDVAAHPFWSGLVLHDLRPLDAPRRARALDELRERLSHRLMAVELGETLDVQMALLPDGRHRLFANVDLLVADALGYATIFSELSALLRGVSLPPLLADYDFRSYLAQRDFLETEQRETDRSYWLARLDRLPEAPALPLARAPETVERVRITRRAVTVEAEAWQKFRDSAKARGLTPTMVLVTCLGAVLGRWSGQSRLLLNLTLFDRQPIHPAVAGMVADFTNLILLDTNCAPGAVGDRACENQQTFTEAWSHGSFSGVEVLRELRRHGRLAHGAPVVFTGLLTTPLIDSQVEETVGTAGWGLSQTPQVWIDHIAVRRGDGVTLQWDCNDDLFPSGMTEAMFAAYAALVERLCVDSAAWDDPQIDILPPEHLAARTRANATAATRPDGCLHDSFFRHADRDPDEIILIDGTMRWTRGELAGRARGLATGLRGLGVKPGDRVGLCLPKGAGQIAAALGVLQAGATYVPVGIDQPADRIGRICADAGLAALVVCADDPAHARHGGAGLPRLAWQDAPVAGVGGEGAVDPGQAAYVIYTSGSTGTPKGVEVSHRSALNTCADLNRRFDVGVGDRVLALSALQFDLSVYDIFGVLGAGGGIVLVNEAERRDPETWCQRILRDGVTVWNTVPALFDMLLTYAEGIGLSAPERLRLVFLSGDWIGRDLPGRYRAFRSDGRFVAMGGATEAAIWSNALDVTEVPAHWPSIPYGFPLANQSYRVVDPHGRDCPDWVAGELWIGGAGLALGYLGDPVRTADRFVSTAAGRWYRTGDMGRYWPDGMLEFLGRRDEQVKIGGYRVELGEIDAAFSRLDGIAASLTVATGEKDRKLSAFVTLKPDAFRTRLSAAPGLPSAYRPWFDPLASGSDDVATGQEVARFLAEHLSRYGGEGGAFRSVAAISDAYGCRRDLGTVPADWMRFLVAQGLAEERDGMYRLHQGRRETLSVPDSVPARALRDALTRHHDPLAALMRGEADILSLLDDPLWAPERVALRLPGMGGLLGCLARLIHDLGGRLGRPVRVVEPGARSGVAAAALLGRLERSDLSYLAFDESAEMVRRGRERLSPWPHARMERWESGALARHADTADIVWINNALHREENPGDILSSLLSLAAPGALVLVAEVSDLPAEALVSSELLRRSDRRRAEIRPAAAWREMFLSCGLTIEAHHMLGALDLFVLRQPDQRDRPDPDAIRAALSTLLPDYMVPRQIRIMDRLPLTANGKVDAGALRALAAASDEARASETPPATEAERLVADLWRDFIGSRAVYRESDFFRLGGDSLLATRLIGVLAREGYQARLEDLFAHPVLAAFAATLRPLAREQNGPGVLSDPAARFDPFPLTDIQQAYLVGRQPGFALGGVASHFFVVFEVDELDFPRFHRAWERLIERHDMLRAVVEGASQRILRDVPPLDIPRHRFRCLDGAAARACEDGLSQETRDPTQWPVFAVHVIEADDTSRRRVLIDLDNLFLDGMSMQILFAELKALYRDPDRTMTMPGLSFRDYVLHAARSPLPQTALDHWRSRLATLPGAPDLPLKRLPQDVSCPRFCRIEDSLSASAWQDIRETAQRHGLTPPVLLLALYAGTISSFSAYPEITLTLTVFDRQPVHPDIDLILGDFTALMLASWRPRRRWIEAAREMQERLREDMVHRGVSAIRVMRDLARRSGVAAVSMPVVFTSALGYDRDEGFLSRDSWLKPLRGISQTPQTWIDLQVYEADGMLFYNWDLAEALFDPDLAQAMAGCFSAALRRLADNPALWDAAPDALFTRDRAALHLPAGRLPCRTQGSPDPAACGEETPLALITGFFRQELGRDIAANANFFDCGATSLNLVQLHAHLGRNGHRSLAITDLFLHATPSALARHLGGTGTGEDAPDDDLPGRRRPRRRRGAGAAAS